MRRLSCCRIASTLLVQGRSFGGGSSAGSPQPPSEKEHRTPVTLKRGTQNGASETYTEGWAQDVASNMMNVPVPDAVPELSTDEVDFVNVELRTLLVGKGEVPIGAVPRFLSEQTRDILAKVGGLGVFVDSYGKKMTTKLAHSSGTFVVMNRHYAPRAFVEKVVDFIKKDGGDKPGGPGVPMASMYPKLSVSMRTYMNLKSGRFAAVLRSLPEIFAVSEDRRLVALASSNPRFSPSTRNPLVENADEILSGGSHAVYMQGYTDRMKSGAIVPHQPVKGMYVEERKDVNPTRSCSLVECLPMGCFVPLTEVAKRLSQEDLKRLCGPLVREDDPLASLMGSLTSLPVNIVDMRMLGDSPDQVFVRLIADQMMVSSASREDSGEERFRDYSVSHLGHDIAEAFRAAGREECTIADLPNVLPKELLDQFPLQGPPAILVFDRMQHLFDVDNVNFAVRLRREGEPFSATMHTTPVPRAMRYFSYSYTTPVLFDELTEHMPPHVTSEIFATFGSVKSFIAAHRLYVFVQQGGLVYTPSIVSSEHTPQVGPALARGKSHGNSFLRSSRTMAEHIHSLLPTDRYVDWTGFQNKHQFPQALLLAVDKPDASIFFNHFPELFKFCYGMGNCNLLIGRSEIPLPKYIWPECMSVHDCLKEIAWCSLGGCPEVDISNQMSREGRLVSKAFGGLDTLCRQMPQWFECVNRAGIVGHTFITYIGHLPDTSKRVELAKSHAENLAARDSKTIRSFRGGNRVSVEVMVNKRPGVK